MPLSYHFISGYELPSCFNRISLTVLSLSLRVLRNLSKSTIHTLRTLPSLQLLDAWI